MKIAITGGAGFIGSHIVDFYIQQGHTVVVIDNFTTGDKKNIHPKASVIEIDIISPELISIFEKEKFDVVNHHAAQLNLRVSTEKPIFDATVNILGTINVLEAVAKSNVSQFIFASTGGALYGEYTGHLFKETDDVSPQAPYGISKLSAEYYVQYFAKKFGFNFTVLRYTNVYGPRQNAKGEAGVVSIFINSLLDSNVPTINGTGKQTRDYVYVTDIAKVNLFVLGLKQNLILNVSCETETSVVDVYNEINNALHFDIEPIFGASILGEVLRSSCSNECLQSNFNWTPPTTLQEGIQQTVEYFVSQRQ